MWCALVLLSIRPVAPAEVALGWVLAPLRVLAEVSAPVRILRMRTVSAADEELAGRFEAEAAERERVLEGLVRAARPPEALSMGRRLVPGSVLGRVPGDLDRLIVRVPASEDLVPGLPVVSGEVFVGRVVRRVPGAADRVEVDLITGPDVYVGAGVGGEPGRAPQVLMAVGGIDPGARRSEAAQRLAVHNPSDRTRRAGEVRVREVLAHAGAIGDEMRHGALADGYLLGNLIAPGRRAAVAPALDYRAGIYQVTVLAPSDGGRPVAPLAEELADGRWRPARALSQGDPSPWREGLVVDTGSRAGVRRGAALVSGLRLLGRVEVAGPVSARVRMLADPGLSLVCVAAIDGEGDPRTLGRLVSAGPVGDGAIAFDWSAALPLEVSGRASGTVSARLYTGAGEPGVPRGLLVGAAELPLGALGRVRLVLTDAADARDLSDLWVRSAEGGE